jgi:hypothetical protein
MSGERCRRSHILTTFVTTSDASADSLLCFPQRLWSYRVRRYDIPVAPDGTLLLDESQ